MWEQGPGVWRHDLSWLIVDKQELKALRQSLERNFWILSPRKNVSNKHMSTRPFFYITLPDERLSSFFFYLTCNRESACRGWNFRTASVDPRYCLSASCLSTNPEGQQVVETSVCHGRVNASGGAGVTRGSRYRKRKWFPRPITSPGFRTVSL